MKNIKLGGILISAGAIISPGVPSWEIPTSSFLVSLGLFGLIPFVLIFGWIMGFALIVAGILLAGKSFKHHLFPHFELHIEDFKIFRRKLLGQYHYHYTPRGYFFKMILR
ncbi:MAG: hypothetical protein HY929_02985 [Euryarchaeota archaeon]|nr:hypothetical protein [Euryarchaeota archaeon]